MEAFIQSVGKMCAAVLFFGTALSCSHQEVNLDSYLYKGIKQTEPIEVGKTVMLPNKEGSKLSLISNSNPQVADVEVSAQGLSVHGKQYGLTTVSVQDAQGKEQSIALSITGQRPALPTELFAEYNVAPDGHSFARTHSPEASGYFDYDAAAKIVIKVGDKTYRTPTKDELHALLPYEEEIAYSGREAKNLAFEQAVTIDGTKLIYGESFYSTGRHVAYALRFGKASHKGSAYAMDNSRLTAFRYEYSVNKDDPKGGFALKITARYLGENFQHDINFIASEGFWNSFTWDDATLILPANGLRLGTEITTRGYAGEYWSTSAGFDDLSASALSFGRMTASSTIHADKSIGRAVRLILSK